MPIDFATDSGYALRLLVAAILGALVGLEREIHDHPAGMRTHLLVSLGSAGFTVLSIAAFPAPGADPARIAAQIVSGIGFLGAGAILKAGATIRGLTTAASLWTVAAVGMAAGAAAWIVAITITVIAIVRLRLVVDDPAALARVISVITDRGGSVVHFATTVRKDQRLTAEIEVRARDLATGSSVTAAVAKTEGVEIDESTSAGD
jgi:uncharacterized membrane protein YhiD involved in acid resistance